MEKDVAWKATGVMRFECDQCKAVLDIPRYEYLQVKPRHMRDENKIAKIIRDKRWQMC